MSRRGDKKRFAYFLTILILVLVMMYSGLRILESTVFYPGGDTDETIPSRTITRNGVNYYPRQDITVVMVMGIDQTGPVADSGSYHNSGKADVAMLLVFDEKNEQWSILQLNRDTMLEIPVLGIGGKQAGTSFGQLALAHTYGSGMEDSCLNTCKAVSDFLYGLDIDYYFAMNMDIVAILNDAVGGVTVTVEDDFSQVDPSITMGEITLKGQQALNFIQSRKDVGDQKNVSRMSRQREYMEGFLEALEASRAQDANFLLKTYEQAAPYLLSDCSFQTLTNLMERYEAYPLVEIVTPEGENVLGEEYYEFYADEEKLDELILRLFYAPKR